jgi:hypothetical protein
MLTIPKKIVDLILGALASGFTGKISINFWQGNISSVDRNESIKI